jgi:SPX domain protein involved in polyphosphate accumulation
MKTSEIRTVDTVRLVSVSRSMNPWLQKQLGRTGVVLSCDPGDRKVRVSFDGFAALWVAVSRLEVVA